jgi:hypothetical protein
MRVVKSGTSVNLVLDEKELQLLRWSLERASFTDTPPEKQEEILNFCTKALEQLGAAR